MPTFDGSRRYRCRACHAVFEEADPRWWDSGLSPRMEARSHVCHDGLRGSCELIGTRALTPEEAYAEIERVLLAGGDATRATLAYEARKPASEERGFTESERSLPTVSYLVVVPVLVAEAADRCFASLDRPGNAAGFDRESVLVVDNTRDGAARFPYRTYRDAAGHNLGAGRSWNIGAREVLARGIDFLVLLSTSMDFGPDMQGSFALRLRTCAAAGAKIVEAQGHSWHLIAFHREVFERVGLFDENFYPAYEEDVDFGRRIVLGEIALRSGATVWPKVWVNAVSLGHGLNSHRVSVSSAHLKAYYAAKWGGAKGEETMATPFDSGSLAHWPAATVPELAERYALREWW